MTILAGVLIICISLIISDVEHLFICILVICMSSLKECLFIHSAYFFMGLFIWHRGAWAIYIFWRLFRCCLLCLQIFPLILWVVFLFMVSFGLWKLLTSIKGHLFVFLFIFITPGGGSKTILLKEKILLQLMSNSALPRFSSESFRVSSFTFQSLIHFEFIFMYDVRAYSKFIILHVTVQFSRHHLLKRLSFWFTSILFRIFASVVFSDIGLSFTFLFVCVCVCVCVLIYLVLLSVWWWPQRMSLGVFLPL